MDKIIDFDNFDDNWEEGPDNDSYKYLEDLYSYINKQSKTGKNSRKFLRYAYDMIQKGDLDEDILNDFVKNNNISEDILKEIKGKINKPMRTLKNYDTGGNNAPQIDMCGRGPSYGNNNQRC